jgi:hypothetical protein
MKKYLLAMGSITIFVLLSGCASTPEHQPPYKPQKVVTLYKADSEFTNIPGSAVSESETSNVRTEAGIERYYNGRYIDPNTGDMYGKGTVYRVVESPHWNTIPNQDPQPYEINEAYKHIHNLANATPLYAELDYEKNKTRELNRQLINKIGKMDQIHKTMQQQAESLSNYQKSMASMASQNIKLKKDNQRLENTAASKQVKNNFGVTEKKEKITKSPESKTSTQGNINQSLNFE